MSDEVHFESPADQAGFTQVPNVVLRDPHLTPPAKVIYALLRSYAWEGDGCFPGQEALAGHLGGCDRSVRRYLRELEASMLIRTERRGSTSNRYTLLALGLRAKRLADRTQVSGRPSPRPDTGVRSDRTQVSDEEDPGKKTQKRESAGAGEREKKLRISGKPVKAEAWALTSQVLDLYNASAGSKLRLLTSAGSPSEAAKRIYGRVVLYPDLTREKYAGIIARTLASKWWGDGAPSIGVVFGPKVFEENITRPGTPAGRGAPAGSRPVANTGDLSRFGDTW